MGDCRIDKKRGGEDDAALSWSLDNACNALHAMEHFDKVSVHLDAEEIVLAVAYGFDLERFSIDDCCSRWYLFGQH